jgi:hypothetical protein
LRDKEVDGQPSHRTLVLPDVQEVVRRERR